MSLTQNYMEKRPDEIREMRMTLIGFRDEIAHDDPNGDWHKRLRAKVILVEIRNGVPFIGQPNMCGFCLLVIALVKAIIFDCLAFCHAVLEILIDVVGLHSTQKGKGNALVICIFLKSLLPVTINSNQTRGDYSACHVILHTKKTNTFFSHSVALNGQK